jgi:heterodisulfide reductase subunit A
LEKEEVRIGVYVCKCGSNIAGLLDVEGLAEYASTLPNVVFAPWNLYTCSDVGLDEIKKGIKEQNLNRVVVASCSPRTHEPLFRSVCGEAGLNPYLFEMVNIRDQCSWVHVGHEEDAMVKARDLIRMGVAKAALLKPQEIIVSEVEVKALVIGSGIAGLTAATTLANRGFPVILLEKEKELGGMLRSLYKLAPMDADASEVINEKIKEAEDNPNIEIYTGATIDKVEGFIGKFNVTFSANGTSKDVRLGVVIIATGAGNLVPEGLYQYDGEKVITQWELEGKLKSGKIDANNVVIIQCVGARSPERQYCSRICCAIGIKNAILIKEMNPEARVHILYRDLMMYGVENEDQLRKAKELGVRFVKYDPERPPVVEENKVTVFHHLMGKELEIPQEMVVLSTPLVGTEDGVKVGNLFRAGLDQNNFFLEAHVKLKPLDCATDGIFICGSAHYPKNVRESILQALGAASRASIPLSQGEVKIEPIVTTLVNKDACRGCGLCVALCPYNALEIKETDEGRKVNIITVACKGCGVCAATCFRHALGINSFTDEQIQAQIHGFLAA